MHQITIHLARWLLLCGLLAGCQAGFDNSCPANINCGDADDDQSFLPASPKGPLVRHADYHPLWPGCPLTRTVMARARPVVFQAARPDEDTSPDDDPSDWVCEPPEVQLLRADLGTGRKLAAR